ncbi:MAG: alpha/beta fold hydrolase [Pseudomonadota bacterium]
MMKAFEIGTKKTIVFYLHGLRGHGLAQKTSLTHVVRNVGVTLVSLELPGHGIDSKVQHCMVPKYELIVADIIATVKAWSEGAEQIILMGYSFGGALMTLAANALERDESFTANVAGLVGISTAFDVAHNVPRWQLALVGVIAPLSRLFYQHFTAGSRFLTIGEMKVPCISPDLAVQKSIQEDDLTYKGRIPLNTSAQVYRAGVAAKQAIDELACEVLLLHSKDDAIAAPPSPTTFAKKVKLRLFENLRHNCIDGRMREAVYARREITEFIAAKI